MFLLSCFLEIFTEPAFHVFEPDDYDFFGRRAQRLQLGSAHSCSWTALRSELLHSRLSARMRNGGHEARGNVEARSVNDSGMGLWEVVIVLRDVYRRYVFGFYK